MNFIVNSSILWNNLLIDCIKFMIIMQIFKQILIINLDKSNNKKNSSFKISMIKAIICKFIIFRVMHSKQIKWKLTKFYLNNNK